jgi:hypothetical protein
VTSFDIERREGRVAFLDEKKKEINGRLAELRPLVAEYEQLQQAANALQGLGPVQATTAPKRGPGRPPSAAPAAAANGRRTRRGRPRKSRTSTSSPSAAAGTSRPGRRKGSGERSVQALKFVTDQPGITIPELAAKMGIKQSYLYRVLPGLEQEKKVKKEGRGWHPASS